MRRKGDRRDLGAHNPRRGPVHQICRTSPITTVEVVEITLKCTTEGISNIMNMYRAFSTKVSNLAPDSLAGGLGTPDIRVLRFDTDDLRASVLIHILVLGFELV